MCLVLMLSATHGEAKYVRQRYPTFGRGNGPSIESDTQSTNATIVNINDRWNMLALTYTAQQVRKKSLE